MFLVNSRYPLFCAPKKKFPLFWALFSRSYEGNLPSSFNIVLSSALVYSTCPPVLVWGTILLSECYFQDFLSSNINPIRHYYIPKPSLSRGYRNINLFSIDYAFPPRLRCRLTLRGLTLRRNPWAFGEGGFHSLCRYSCQHSHFRYLQHTLQYIFTGLRNAPLPLAIK